VANHRQKGRRCVSARDCRLVEALTTQNEKKGGLRRSKGAEKKWGEDLERGKRGSVRRGKTPLRPVRVGGEGR